MANTKLADQPAIVTPAGTDLLYTEQGGSPFKETLAQVTAPLVLDRVNDNHTLASTLDAATGNEVALSLDYTVNKATSGDDTGLRINQIDTLSPGTSLLANFLKGGTSQVSIDNIGNITSLGRLQVSGDVRNVANDRWFLADAASSPTQSVFIPVRSDLTSGYGGAAGVPNVIVTGDEAMNHSESSNLITTKFDAGDNQAGNVGAWTAHVSAVATLTAASGTTLTASNLIPDGALVFGVTTRITTEFTTVNGMTSFEIGDGSDADYWGSQATFTAGETTSDDDFTVTTVQRFTSANDIVITAIGGTGFDDGVGVIEIVVHYWKLTAPTG